MTNHRKAEGALVAFIFAGALVVAAALTFVAHAATKAGPQYPKAHGERFHSGAHGWASTIHHDGTCVDDLTCPPITNTAPSTGGAGGKHDGYIETAEGGLVAPGAIATSSGAWESPAFRYRGNDGAKPARLTLSLARRADVAALVSAGGTVEYSVELVDKSRGPNVVLVDGKDVTDNASFAELPSVKVDPDRLDVGDRYAVRITTRYQSSADAVPAASVDYDNVLLKAGGTKGPGGNAGPGIPARAHAASTSTAVVIGRHLYLRTRCAQKAHVKRCKRRFTAVKHRHGTRKSTTAHSRVKRGRSHLVSVRLKRSFAHKLAHKHSVLIRERATKRGHRTNTRYVRFHVKH